MAEYLHQYMPATAVAGQNDAALAVHGLGSIMEGSGSITSDMSPLRVQGADPPSRVFSYDGSLEMQSHAAYAASSQRFHRKQPSDPRTYSPAPAAASQYTQMGHGYLPTSISTGINCTMAADIISTMTGADPHQIQSSFGCLPGQQCQVDEGIFATTLDRYTPTAAHEQMH